MFSPKAERLRMWLVDETTATKEAKKVEGKVEDKEVVEDEEMEDGKMEYTNNPHYNL